MFIFGLRAIDSIAEAEHTGLLQQGIEAPRNPMPVSAGADGAAPVHLLPEGRLAEPPCE